MTDGPYPGSIRDDSDSGLGGIFTQLAAVANGLSLLPQIAADLRVLVGTTQSPGWPGLSLYLHRAVAANDEAEITGRSMNRELKDTRAFVLDILLAVAGGASHLPGNFNVWNAIRNAVESTNAQYILENPDRSGILTNTALMRAVLGGLGDNPNGATIKELLRDIGVSALRSAECCAEPVTPPVDPANPENPAPSDVGCPDKVRATGWLLLRTDETPQGQFTSTWQAVFATAIPGLARYQSATAPGGYAYNIAGANTRVDVCLAWDFTGNTRLPLGYGAEVNPDPENVANDTFTGRGLAQGSTLTKGGFVNELERCVTNDPLDRYVSNAFKFGGTAVPALNVWISTIQRACLS